MAGLLEALGLRPPVRAAVKAAGATPSPAAAPVDKATADYLAERAAVTRLVTALRAHRQAARIAALIGQVGAKQGSAAAHAAQHRWPEAMRDLAEARRLAVAAHAVADGWDGFAAKLADANAQVSACEGLADDLVATARGNIAAAMAKAKASPPDFVTALALLGRVDDGLHDKLPGRVTSERAKLTALRGLSADVQTYLAGELAAAAPLVARAEAALAAKDWSQLIMSAMAADDILAPAVRIAQRRDKYEKQRLTTAGDIASVRADPATKGRGAALQAMLAEADALAGHERLRIEEGTATLVSASNRCKLLKSVAPTIVAYEAERKAADAEFAALTRHRAAAEVASAREAIRTLLDQAAAQATRGQTAPVPTVAWQGALTLVQRARADIGSARQLADRLGPSAAAEQAATATPPQVPALKKALADLKSHAALAAKGPGADQIADALQRFGAATDEADQALARKDAKAAAGPLQRAAKALADAHAIQALHAQFLDSLQAVEAQLRSLQDRPTARVIQPKIEAVAQALAEARRLDAAHAGADAIGAVRRASDAVGEAEEADHARVHFDAQSKKVGARILAEVHDPKQSKPMMEALVTATERANAFRFNEAHHFLQQLVIQLDKGRLEAGVKSKPPDPHLKDIAARMVEEGGAKEVDALIQSRPDGIDPAVIGALASGRYGVTIVIGGTSPGKNEVRAMKRICEMFSKIPDDVRGNKSITRVTNTDATGKAGGAYYPASGRITLEGRRGEIQQEFGAHLKQRDPKTGDLVSQLPKNIDPTCKAQKEDEEVEYIGFAAAHEVGHGVDDERGFMAQFGMQEAKGGWVDYGGGVQAIADAVGPHIAAKTGSATFYRDAATRRYVLDKIMHRPAERPAAAKHSPEAAALDAFDRWHAIATSKDVYRRQPDCDEITIGSPGRIYHEAYPRQWVSYLAAARTKALTGYQFRAPGEWFAELYAGWKTGKLGPRHPALDWLKKL